MAFDKLLRKALYTGIGVVTSTTERLQKAVDDLVQRGKISEEEGKKVVDDVVKNTEYKREEYEGRFRKLIDSTLSKLNLPQYDAYDKLEKRVKSLEVKLGLLIKELEAQRQQNGLSAALSPEEDSAPKAKTRKNKKNSLAETED